jgi:maltose O-acetyltransferase
LVRLVSFLWVHLVMLLTSWLPDIRPCLKLRGLLVRPALKRCGRNFQLAQRVTLNFPNCLEVGNDVYFAAGCWLHAPGGIVVEDEVQLGPYVVLITGDHSLKDGSYRFGPGARAPIRLQRGCWLAAHTTVIKGVTVGRGALVAANAVVTQDVPDFSIVGGVPARILRENVDPGATP